MLIRLNRFIVLPVNQQKDQPSYNYISSLAFISFVDIEVWT